MQSAKRSAPRCLLRWLGFALLMGSCAHSTKYANATASSDGTASARAPFSVTHTATRRGRSTS
eukprot:2847552-Prymnesium_polylepis.1